jgi:hypothetical protein
MPSKVRKCPNDCPDWDKRGCHGPVMTKGAQAYGGSDWNFLYFMRNLPHFRGHNTLLVSLSFIQSFVFVVYRYRFLAVCVSLISFALCRHSQAGEIQDEESMKVVNHIIMELPSKTMRLNFSKPLHIDIAMIHE